MKKIGIVGATGMIGKPVTHAFIEAGWDVTILVRDSKKGQSFFGNKVRYIVGDVVDTASLKNFLAGVKYLYLNLSVAQKSYKNDFQPEREGLQNILAVAKELGVCKIGYLSSLAHFYQGQNGFNWWMFNLKQNAVKSIKASGIPYIIFYASTFMESFDKGAYRQGKFIALSGVSKYKMFLIAADDYGRQVVKAFELENGNLEFVVQGEEGFTADEAANYYTQYCKHNKPIIAKSPFIFLKIAALFSNKFKYGAKMIEALNNYPEMFEAEKTWEMLGKPQTQFKEYILARNIPET